MRIAHLSDVHILELGGVPLRRLLFNKRLTGLANLAGHRKGAHPPEILTSLVEGLLADPVDHVVITGDLSNLALESEFERTRALLAPLGGYERVSLIPGNHDLYTHGALRARRFDRHFGHLIWPPETPTEERTYPWFKDLGGIKLLGFNSCYPTPPLCAWGSVDRGQLDRLAQLAAEHDLDQAFTLALVHHNLHHRGWRKDLLHGFKGRDAFMAACARAGVDLLLHGHTHSAHRFERDGITIIGSGSSTWSATDPDKTARYNVYHIDPPISGGEGRLTRTEVRVYDFETQRFTAAS